uniref:Galectin n=1 Tax=Vombatus ursinus TaxID=29139 RepID=A0A4X2KYX2_VOMUR
YVYRNKSLPFVEPPAKEYPQQHTASTNWSYFLDSWTRFHVDFRCGTSGNDIAFHFNPRFQDGDHVVCNTKKNGCWGIEERKMQMPFRKGESFGIRFWVETSSCWQVTVNGNLFVQYQHRIPLQCVDTIMIGGIVQLAYVNFQVRTRDIRLLHHLFSLSKLRTHWVVALTTGTHCPIYFSAEFGAITLPFRASICGGLSPAKSMLASGSVLPSAYWFVINLRSGNDMNAVIWNSHIAGSWGPKELNLLGAMPFIRGQTFKVSITCEAHCFKVTVNGHYLFGYNHQVKNLPSINLLEVAGDIHLTHVQI